MCAMPRTIGQYQVREELAPGGWADVYRAWDQSRKKDVVLKILRLSPGLPREIFERFANEAAKLALLTNDSSVTNIVRFYSLELWKAENRPCIVLEFIVGGSLRQRLNENGGRLNPHEACQIVLGAARGAAWIHKVTDGIHRDIKPENILLDNNIAKLTDLGIWRLRPNSSPHGKGPTNFTAGGVLKGSQGYNAPEVERQEDGKIDTWSDVYSLGVVLYELLTGHLPSPPEQGELYKITPSPIRSPNSFPGVEIPSKLDAICLKCLKTEPEERCRTADDLAEELERILATLPPPSANEPVLRYQGPKLPGRLTRVLLGICAACVLATVLLIPKTFTPLRVRNEEPTHSSSGEVAAKEKGQDQVNSVPRDQPLAKESSDVHSLKHPPDRQIYPILLLGHTGRVKHLIFTPDGRHLISGSNSNHIRNEGRTNFNEPGNDNTVRIWDIETGHQVHCFLVKEGIGYGIQGIALSPDGRFVAACTSWEWGRT